MRLRDDRRAAALQVGAILLFGFLIIGLSIYQATVVPDQNERVEFEHNQEVQGSLQEVRNGILRTVASERSSPTTVPLGTRYPTRVVAVNPPPSSGRLTTEPGGSVTVANATAINDETADFWNGTDRSYGTRRLSYDPDYSVYRSAPRTTYDDTVVYNRFDGESRARTDQLLLSGNRITVVSLNGSLSRAGTDSVSVSPTAVSASDRTVAVNGSDVRIRADTELSTAEWRDLLEPQYESNGGRIEGDASGVQVAGETLTVDLVPGTYRLRMAKVGVGTGVADTTESYLTVVRGADGVSAGGTRRIELEVRDAYNNPVAGVDVNASVNRSDASIRPSRATSDEEGLVVFEYGAPESVASPRVDGLNFTYDGSADRADFDGEAPESVRLNVTAVSAGGGGGGGSSATLEYVDGSAQAIDESGNTNVDESVRFTLRNTGSRDVTVTEISVDSTSANANRVRPNPTSVRTDSGGEVTTTITIGGDAEPFDPDGVFAAGTDTEVVIGGFGNGNTGGGRSISGETVGITLTFADGTTRSYLIDVP